MEEEQSSGDDRVATGLAAGWVILRHRPYRRNLLFGTTLLTLLMVFLGAVPLGPMLMNRPLGFTVFWAVCFLMVGFVLVLAVYDLIRIRRDHRKRMRTLEKELAAAAEEAKRIAREEAERGEGS
ncbi:MAG: hypothetical protein WD342_15390 [Verrucomicrobiales bacterium]